MNILNNRNKIAALLIGALVVGPIACKETFLEVPITGNLTETQLGTQAGLEKLLIGVYANLNGRDAWHGGATNWLWGSIRGGEANKGTNSGDFNSMNPVENYAIEPTNSEVAAKWAKSYEGVVRANILIKTATASTDVSDAVKSRILAESRFLRGFYYFELRKNFGMVPYIDESVDGTAAYVIKNDTDVWPKIEEDLKFAYATLTPTMSAIGRANKYAAGALLGKAYLYQKKWADAKTVLDDVVANGVTSTGVKYALHPNFAQLFRLSGENSAESVFAFQATGGASNVNNSNQEYAMAFPYNTLPGNCCGFFQPTFELASSYRVDATGLPLLDNSFRSPANELKNDEGITSATAFTPDAGLIDPRLDLTIGRRGIPFLDWGPHAGFSWIRDQTYAGPYSPKKYTYAKAEATSNDGSGWTPGYTAINFMIIRFSDVLLMDGEAHIMTGDFETARTYINMIRTRAGNTASWVKDAGGVANAANYMIGTYLVPFASEADALTKLRFERKLELGLEGHRFYDLIRWGTAAAELNAYLAYDGAKIPSHFLDAQFTVGKDELLPIPQRQIDLQTAEVLKQNPNY
ncbi:MAG TPA: RagB/SusD family nutrient uptake outer membrane protein [Cyclobacteriaceae bacterium]|nr:RagB/SusD family nutrient uptake outer membrane protein [Cyclobacteriaceae bacterium]